MSLLIDVIGQLNRDIIGCETCKWWLLGFVPSIVSLVVKAVSFLLPFGLKSCLNEY